MNLEYLGFLVTVVALIEENTLHVVKGVYGLGRSRVPGLCIPLMTKGEHTLSTTYSTIRSWFGKHGTAVLNIIDNTVGDGVQWVKDMCPETLKDKIVVVKEFWKKMASHVADAWARHGVLLGTLVVLVALFYALLHLWLEVWNSAFIQEHLRVVRESTAAKLASSYFQENFEPVLTDITKVISNTAERTYDVTTGSIESVKKSFSDCIDGVLASQMYARIYDAVQKCVDKLQTITCVQLLSKKMTPVWETLEKNEGFVAFMDKLKPAKEHGKEE